MDVSRRATLALLGGAAACSKGAHATQDQVVSTRETAPENVGSIPHMLHRRATHVALSSPTGPLMIGGFATEGQGLRQVERFDEASSTFRPFGDLVVSRIQPLAHALPGGRILVMGGEWSKDQSTAEIGDASGSFRPLGNMVDRRTAAASVLLDDGRVLISGGSNRRGEMVTTTEFFDPVSGRFQQGPQMKSGRAGHTMTKLLDGRILIVGGGLEDRVLNSTEVLDPRLERFRLGPDLRNARYKQGAALQPNGSILVIGGSDNLSGQDGRGRLGDCEVYDAVRDDFVSGPRLAEPRYKLEPSTITLSNGAIMVASGGSRAEILYLGERDFVALGPAYDTRRDYMAAVALVSGKALITGGYDANISATNRTYMLTT